MELNISQRALKDEQVLCIARTHLVSQIPEANNVDCHGVFDFNTEQLSHEQFEFLPRNLVDGKLSTTVADLVRHTNVIGYAYPQILGYALITYQGNVLTYARKVSSEKRLLNSRSIGFGGHINPEDAHYTDVINTETNKAEERFDLTDTLWQSLEREFEEELKLHPADFFGLNCKSKNKAVIDNRPLKDNDGSKLAVGQVHVGVIFHFDLDVNMYNLIKETSEVQDLKLQSWQELQDDIDMYESWSRLIINQNFLFN